MAIISSVPRQPKDAGQGVPVGFAIPYNIDTVTPLRDRFNAAVREQLARKQAEREAAKQQAKEEDKAYEDLNKLIHTPVEAPLNYERIFSGLRSQNVSTLQDLKNDRIGQRAIIAQRMGATREDMENPEFMEKSKKLTDALNSLFRIRALGKTAKDVLNRVNLSGKYLDTPLYQSIIKQEQDLQNRPPTEADLDRLQQSYQALDFQKDITPLRTTAQQYVDKALDSSEDGVETSDQYVSIPNSGGKFVRKVNIKLNPETAKEKLRRTFAAENFKQYGFDTQDQFLDAILAPLNLSKVKDAVLSPHELYAARGPSPKDLGLPAPFVGISEDVSRNRINTDETQTLIPGKINNISVSVPVFDANFTPLKTDSYYNSVIPVMGDFNRFKTVSLPVMGAQADASPLPINSQSPYRRDFLEVRVLDKNLLLKRMQQADPSVDKVENVNSFEINSNGSIDFQVTVGRSRKTNIGASFGQGESQQIVKFSISPDQVTRVGYMPLAKQNELFNTPLSAIPNPPVARPVAPPVAPPGSRVNNPVLEKMKAKTQGQSQPR